MHLHTQIEQYIYDQIISGKLKPGDRIETETKLIEKFGASRPTVRQALNKLSDLGYLMRIKGNGSFITEPKVLHKSTCFIASYRKEVEFQNHRLLTQVLSLESVSATKDMCSHFNIKARSIVSKLVRLRRIEGFDNQHPVVYTTVYIPQSRFSEMMSYDFSNVSLYDTLEKHNLKVNQVSRKLEVLLPSPIIAEFLEISIFEPVIFVTSYGYLKNGIPIEYSESYYPASNSKFLIEIHN